jgi:hypothetical protein
MLGICNKGVKSFFKQGFAEAGAGSREHSLRDILWLSNLCSESYSKVGPLNRKETPLAVGRGQRKLIICLLSGIYTLNFIGMFHILFIF